MSAIHAEREVGELVGWRAVAMPSEHGGWGLTLEPVLLGLLVAWSTAGVALGIAAFTAFLLRTPAKLVAVDIRRGRWLDRSRLALRIAIVETVVLAAAVAVAIMVAGWVRLVPVLVAGPLVAIELSFEIRSRGRRLVPEVCGAVGIAAVAASIVLAGDRMGQGPVWQSDLAQVAAVAIVTVAMMVDRRLLAGLVGVLLLTLAQSVWVRQAPIPAKRLGLRETAIGIALVAVTAVGVLW